MSFASLNPLPLLFPTFLASGLFAPADDGPANGSVGLTPCQTGRADQVIGANRSASRPTAIVTAGLGRRCGSSCPITRVAATSMERLTMVGGSRPRVCQPATSNPSMASGSSQLICPPDCVLKSRKGPAPPFSLAATTVAVDGVEAPMFAL